MPKPDAATRGDAANIQSANRDSSTRPTVAHNGHTRAHPPTPEDESLERYAPGTWYQKQNWVIATGIYRTLSPAAKAVYEVMCFRRSSRSGLVDRPLKEIAYDAGVETGTASRARAELQRRGLAKRIRGKIGKFGCEVWRITTSCAGATDEDSARKHSQGARGHDQVAPVQSSACTGASDGAGHINQKQDERDQTDLYARSAALRKRSRTQASGEAGEEQEHGDWREKIWGDSRRDVSVYIDADGTANLDDLDGPGVFSIWRPRAGSRVADLLILGHDHNVRLALVKMLGHPELRVALLRTRCNVDRLARRYSRQQALERRLSLRGPTDLQPEFVWEDGKLRRLPAQRAVRDLTVIR